jgi:hypothetical protein
MVEATLVARKAVPVGFAIIQSVHIDCDVHWSARLTDGIAG